MRKLATVEVLSDVRPIEGADMIVAATVRGWTVVVKKGEFSPGDECVYFEIDSFLPASDERFQFLLTRGQKTLPDGSTGHVLKTAKLRGVFSQGLALPRGEFPEMADANVGDDVSERLGVFKYEPPIPASLAGRVVGAFPSWLAKTDEERVQNLVFELPSFFPNGVFEEWEAYEKIDGSSVTVFFEEDGTLRVASRNWVVEETDDNTMWRVVRELGIPERMSESGIVAVQGEVFGPGIQGNPLKMVKHQFRVFDVWVANPDNVGQAERLGSLFYPGWVNGLRVPRREDIEGKLAGLPVSPQLFVDAVNKMKSVITPGATAEGVVFRHPTQTFIGGSKASFKAINNTFLLKSDR